jgi:protein required for attachment to host cells
MSYRRTPRTSRNTWILTADRSKAIIYQAQWPELQKLDEACYLIHAEGASRPEDVQSDRPGRFAAFGVPRQSGEPATDFRHRTARDFAIRLVERLEQGRANNQFGRLILIAPPLLLGVLRDVLPSPLAKRLVLELGKDLVTAPKGEVLEQVQEGLEAVLASV